MGGIVIDTEKHEVLKGGVTVHLTPKEFDLLVYLCENQGRVLTQRQILSKVWGPEYVDDAHILRTFVYQLRTKLAAADPAAAGLIANDPGVGYRLVPAES